MIISSYIIPTKNILFYIYIHTNNENDGKVFTSHYVKCRWQTLWKYVRILREWGFVLLFPEMVSQTKSSHTEQYTLKFALAQCIWLKHKRHNIYIHIHTHTRHQYITFSMVHVTFFGVNCNWKIKWTMIADTHYNTNK